MKKVISVSLFLAGACSPAFAGGDYQYPWSNEPASEAASRIQGPMQEGRSSVTETLPDSVRLDGQVERRVTGGEVDHHKAPIYFYLEQR